jgi:predicted O-methyltransferase YrrM
MNKDRLSLLKELEQFGAENDCRVTERRDKMLNITPETGAVLALLVGAMKARRILEIGTSNGYSTLWLADAVESLNSHVITVEALPAKADLGRQNLTRAGLSASVEVMLCDAGAFLQQQPQFAFDFVFLDADRGQYVGWWADLDRLLSPGGLLVVDNAVSHAQDLSRFFELVSATPCYTTVMIPVGKGEFLALKRMSYLKNNC